MQRAIIQKIPSIWQQKGGEQYGLSNYTFIGGHGTGSWSLRVQVVRPS